MKAELKTVQAFLHLSSGLRNACTVFNSAFIEIVIKARAAARYLPQVVFFFVTLYHKMLNKVNKSSILIERFLLQLDNKKYARFARRAQMALTLRGSRQFFATACLILFLYHHNILLHMCEELTMDISS